jgi:hypothetical protein
MKKIKISRNTIVIGGLFLAGAALFIHSQKCGILKPLFKNQCVDPREYDMGPSIADPDPFVIQKLEEEMLTRPITDDYVQTYNRYINGYRENPTMFPEDYYQLPFRFDPRVGILSSPDVPDSFGSNPINPNPNYWDRWIRQDFSF